MRRSILQALVIIWWAFEGVLHAGSTIPLVLAERAVEKALKDYPSDKEARLTFIETYCRAFLDEWRFGTMSHTTVSFSDKIAQSAYAAGVEDRIKLRGEFNVSPSDYGYTIKTITGFYSGGFEVSELIEEPTKEKFHVNFGDVEGLPQGVVRVQAWVSPEHHIGFGHDALWKREIILIKHLKEEQGTQSQK